MNQIIVLKIYIVGVVALLLQTVTGSLFIPIDQNLRKSNKSLRQLQGQQTLTYRANYTADFQYLQHPSCTSESPLLIVQCTGGTITILETSDVSILCNPYTADGIESGTALECINTCNDTACESVYLERGGVQPIEGVFGSIRFMCESNTLDFVAAKYNFSGASNAGSCAADTTTTKTNNRRVAKMGISCPIEESGSNIREYVYDDTYFECRDSVSYNLALIGPDLIIPEDVYGCFSGKDCMGEECTFEFDHVVIDTTKESFSMCIEALVDIDPFPIPEPVSTVLIHTVRFEAFWGTSATIANEPTNQCATHYTDPTIRITCRNGATAITYINSTLDVDMECNKISDIEMECSSSVANRATNVLFDCAGLSIPSAIVTFPATTAFCVNNTQAALFENIVSLAASCGNILYSFDKFFECGDRRNFFFIAYNTNIPDRYACSESTTIEAGSSTEDTMAMQNVSVMTDTFWLSGSELVDTCVTKVSRFSPTTAPISLPTPPPATPIVSSPSSYPVPVVSPVSSPTASLPDPTATAPTVTAPVPAMDMISSPNESSDTILIAAVAGGIVGGIIISLLALFVYRKGRNDALGTNSVTDIKHKPFGTTVDPSDRFTDDRTTSAATSSSPSNVQTPAASAGAPGTTRLVVDPPTTDYYQVHYKDQSRSVIGGIPRQYTPVVTPQSFSGKPPVQDVPFATAVPVSVISQLGESDSNIGTALSASRSSLRTAAVIRNNPPSTTASSNTESDIAASMNTSNSTLRTNTTNAVVNDRPTSTVFELEFYEDIMNPSSTLDNNNQSNETVAVHLPPQLTPPITTTTDTGTPNAILSNNEVKENDDDEEKKPPARNLEIFEC